MAVQVYVVLLHYPVTNRQGHVVTTAVTNMDIHDISRSCRTYGVKGFYIVTPVVEQHELINRILAHWRSERSLDYHPHRVEALSLVRLAWDFDEVKTAIEREHGERPEVVLTDARALPEATGYQRYREDLWSSRVERPVALVFGTGWGVSQAFYTEVHKTLAPVFGPEGAEGYNHLSVRAAVAAILDRLFGT